MLLVGIEATSEKFNHTHLNRLWTRKIITKIYIGLGGYPTRFANFPMKKITMHG